EAPQTEAATATPEAGSETEASQPETDTEPQAETETDTEPQAETETPAEPVLETGTPAAPAPAESEAEALPALDPDAGHVSEEPILVEEVAEPGAEDGAGAEVHVAEPWDGFRQMAADDVIDRISGASAAELAAVELYELSHRNRRTVLAAVEQELARADR
ncbi:MAG TPA: hypothetical protein VGH45_13715, partial [Solirubrobacteraceae bacterium]